MEQDLSTVGHEPLPLLEESLGGVTTEEAGPHDRTTNKSVAMDLTGVESVPSEPNLAAFQQVCVVYVVNFNDVCKACSFRGNWM